MREIQFSNIVKGLCGNSKVDKDIIDEIKIDNEIRVNNEIRDDNGIKVDNEIKVDSGIKINNEIRVDSNIVNSIKIDDNKSRCGNSI